MMSSFTRIIDTDRVQHETNGNKNGSGDDNHGHINNQTIIIEDVSRIIHI